MEPSIKIILSPQAASIVRRLREFDEEEFKEWLFARGLPIGTSAVLEYLQAKDVRENKKPEPIEMNHAPKR